MTKLIFSRFFINLKCSEVNTSFAMIKSKVFLQLPSEQLKIRPRGMSSGQPLCESSAGENAQISSDSFTDFLIVPPNRRSTGRIMSQDLLVQNFLTSKSRNHSTLF